jgi:hypothetical protein
MGVQKHHNKRFARNRLEKLLKQIEKTPKTDFS